MSSTFPSVSDTTTLSSTTSRLVCDLSQRAMPCVCFFILFLLVFLLFYIFDIIIYLPIISIHKNNYYLYPLFLIYLFFFFLIRQKNSLVPLTKPVLFIRASHTLRCRHTWGRFGNGKSDPLTRILSVGVQMQNHANYTQLVWRKQ